MFAIALLSGTALLVLMAPLVLASGKWQVFRPRTALAVWFCALLAGLVLGVSAIVAGLIAAANYSGTGVDAAFVSMAAWLAVFTIAGSITLVSALNEPLVHSYRRSLGRIAPVASHREDRGTYTLVRFDSPEPVSIAIPGREPEILLSSALSEMLTTPQLHALLAHEYAHLKGRHDLLVRVAEINAGLCPGFLPAGRLLKRATLLLVELAADDVAARQAGTEQLALALDALAEATGDVGIATRAERLRALPGAELPGVGLPAPVLV